MIVTRSVLYYGISTHLVVHLAGDRHLGAAMAAFALTAFTGFGAFTVLMSSRIAAQVGRIPTLVLGYLATLAALAGLLTVPSPAAAVALAGVLGALGIPVPCTPPLARPSCQGISASLPPSRSASPRALVE